MHATHPLFTPTLECELSPSTRSITRLSIKSLTTIGILAISVLGSMGLAYQNPNRWILTATGISLLNFYTLPILFKTGKNWMIKAALSTSLVSLGSLTTGGIGAFSALFASRLLSSLKQGHLSQTLFNAFILTSLVGYSLPVCQMLLQKAYNTLNKTSWQEQLAHLKAQLQELPSWRSDQGICNLWQGALLTVTLIAPFSIQSALLACCLIFRIKFSAYLMTIWTISPTKGLERISSLINQIIFLKEIANLFQAPIPAEASHTLFALLKRSLNDLNDEEERQKALYLVQTKLHSLISQWITSEQFVDLFSGALLTTTNAKLDEFIQDVEKDGGKLQALEEDYERLVQDLAHLDHMLTQPLPEQSLLERLNSLQQEWTRLKEEAISLTQSKQIWLGFFDVLKNLDEQLIAHFSQSERFGHFATEQAARLQKLHELYFSLFGLDGSTVENNLAARFQRLSNLVNSQSTVEREPIQAWLFLGAERCNFRMVDYEDLQQWCDLDSLNDLEAKFEEMGLNREEDLYEKGILPRHEMISKQQIKDNLRRYIEERVRDERGINRRLQATITQLTHASLSLQVLSQKITQALYFLVTAGLIAVPVLLHPVGTAIGFGMRMAWFALMHFGGPRLENHFSAPREHFRILERINLIDLTHSRQNQQRFMQASSIERIRLIHAYILSTIFMAYAPLFRMGMGGVLQGIGLARALINNTF